MRFHYLIMDSGAVHLYFVTFLATFSGQDFFSFVFMYIGILSTCMSVCHVCDVCLGPVDTRGEQ